MIKDLTTPEYIEFLYCDLNDGDKDYTNPDEDYSDWDERNA